MELLVRLIDRSEHEADSKRGDVVTAQPDGWGWSQAERTNPDWMIIKVAGMLATDSDALTHVAAPRQNGRFRRREWHINLDSALLSGRCAWPRSSESITVARGALSASMRRKAPLP